MKKHPTNDVFMSNRGKRNYDDADELEQRLKKFLVNRPNSLFLYRPDLVNQVTKKDNTFSTRLSPNSMITMGKRVRSPIGFNIPGLHELLKQAKEDIDEKRAKRVRSPIGRSLLSDLQSTYPSNKRTLDHFWIYGTFFST